MPTVGYKETQYAYANTENGRVSLFNRFIDSFLFFNNLLLCVLFATSTSDHLLIIRSETLFARGNERRRMQFAQTNNFTQHKSAIARLSPERVLQSIALPKLVWQIHFY